MFDVNSFHKDLKEKLKTQNIDFFRQLLEDPLKILKKEPIFLSLESHQSFIIGDTHGDTKSTVKVIETALDREKDQQVVFLGDYVDRSEDDIENFHLILEFKRRFPNRVFLLRGNHEAPEINERYGFQDNLASNGLKPLTKQYIEIMGELPVAAQIGKTFLVHGGIAENLTSLDKIRMLKKSISPKDDLTIQLLWNDPEESIEGFEVNIFRGPEVRLFGSKAFESFMTANNLEYMIRAHVPYPKGYAWFFNEKLLSIFTCKKYYGKPRIIAETNGETKPIVLNLDSL
ncbi:MAG: metallophosphoesterase [Candidatus Hermodarchaeota archaeon]